MAAAGIYFTLESMYTRGISGVSIQAGQVHQRAIDALPIVDLLQRNQVVTLQSVASFTLTGNGDRAMPPKPFLAHDYTGLNEGLKKQAATGKGVRVGIIDSGIDYRHRAFGNCYKTTNCRIKFGYDFVGEDFDGISPPQPDDDPLDTCNSHGTAVAGIIAGNDGEFRGVAPEAELGIYRVMSCKNVLYDRFIIDAVTKALEDGMTIINISLGTKQGFFWTVLSKFAKQIGQKNKIVMAVVGNLGSQYMFTMYSPAVSTSTLGVGSYELPYYYSLPLTCHLSSGNFTIPRSAAQRGAPDLQLPPTELALGTDVNGQITGCMPMAHSLSGKVALMIRGGCAVQTKVDHAEAAGAIAAIVYDYIQEPLGTYELDSPNHISTVMLQAGRVMVSSQSAPAIFKHKAPYTVSEFSSWGPGMSIETKPDLLGPGSNLYVPVSLAHGSYGIVSGTSFATAYMTGCAALVAQVKTINYLRLVRELGVNANLQRRSDGIPLSVAQQGRGMLNLTNLLTENSVGIGNVPAELGGMEKLAAGTVGPRHDIKVVNWTGRTRTIYLRHVPAISVSSFGPNGEMLRVPRTSKSTANVGFDIKKIVQTTTDEYIPIIYNITHFNQSDFWVYSGYFEVADQPWGGNVLDRLAYLGMAASRKTIPLLPPVGSPDAPCLTRGKSKACIPIGSNVTFTMQGDDFPSMRYRLQFGNTNSYFTVITKPLFTNQADYLINNGDPSGTVRNDFGSSYDYTALWDGFAHMSYDGSTVRRFPPGKYRFHARFCKPGWFCSARTVEWAFDTWQSDDFYITG
ncbi:hypothetical protein H4R35_003796 [Dimargaris xerosporica]|nr:hypothetical protein H4R35_003796 [Dimargaris xerosporica]